MSYDFQAFSCPSLSNYKVSTSTWEYPDRICGYDQQGHSWRGTELVAIRQKGLIIKECAEKTILLGEMGHLLGYIRECFDCTWLASSCYFADILEISGFKSEFYAVRYLHQVMEAAFPNIKYAPVPPLCWENETLLSERPEQAIFEEDLNALLGYIQEYHTGIWCASSCYYMNQIKVIGFMSEFYATRYLYQITELVFPSMIQNIPHLGKIL
ncbi:hypothetical protein CLI64_28210 [Nostoc sp. CENA543]|uniref:hypothetical protein n=1 Tax=Nostoc sp. CENA543 TaxID=1869241 RepID=UPI000CA3549A|nr:hypothetical protein [Nostoc sp. CENA543]AUT03956.1 hypothetical protein CLI64_28210 [Nostoc sp. CENA543]